MEKYPPVAIVLLTYARFDYAKKTLRSALANTRYDGKIRVIIADDGSPEGYRDRLVEAAATFVDLDDIIVTNAERGGYGKNYNLATQAVHPWASYALMLEDDWELLRPLDLNHLVDVMRESQSIIGCLRLGYLAWTHELSGTLAYFAGEHVLVLDPDSDEKHIFAGHARLDSVEWQKRLGPWPEGLAPGETELAVCGRRESRWDVAWPLDYVKPQGDLFVHVGTIPSTAVG